MRSCEAIKTKPSQAIYGFTIKSPTIDLGLDKRYVPLISRFREEDSAPSLQQQFPKLLFENSNSRDLIFKAIGDLGRGSGAMYY